MVIAETWCQEDFREYFTAMLMESFHRVLLVFDGVQQSLTSKGLSRSHQDFDACAYQLGNNVFAKDSIRTVPLCT